MAIYESEAREFELINNFNVAKLIKENQGFILCIGKKEIKEKNTILLQKKKLKFSIKKGKTSRFYDKMSKPEDVSDLNDFYGSEFIL
jgi:CRISPR-associated endonuclease Csn1